MSTRQQDVRAARLDWLFIFAMASLATIGILFIYSASYRGGDEWMTAPTRKQVVWVLVGALCFVGAVRLDYRRLAGHAWLIYLACLVLLILVLVMGVKIYGAYRWLDVFGIRIQPSEFAKLGTLLLVARYLSMPSRRMNEWSTLIVSFLIMAVPFLLVLQQPDLGTALMLFPVTLSLLFVGGIPVRFLVVLGILGILMSPLGWYALDDYQKERLLVFFDASRDPLGSGWNKIQSEIAVGSGGLTGKGYLMGTQNMLGFLPRTVAPTDFIFSVIAEESGFAGALLMLGLYAVLFACGIRAARHARDTLGRLIATGVVALLFCHVFVNIAMTVGLAPITGLPLPLVSYGGSFMVCTMTLLGLVQSVYVRRIER